MTNTELTKAGFNIDMSYEPLISKDELQKTFLEMENDKFEPYYNRNFSVTQNAIKLSETGENILIIGHATTLGRFFSLLLLGAGCTQSMITHMYLIYLNFGGFFPWPFAILFYLVHYFLVFYQIYVAFGL